MKEINLTRGLVTLVDDEDYEWLNQYKWYAKNGRGDLFYAYRAIRIGGKQVLVKMHREIMRLKDGDYVDHIDRNGLNNQKCNLRICTITQNQYNKRAHRGGTSNYIGVSKKGNKYVAQIEYRGQKKNLGYFFTEKEAAIAYDKMVRKCFGEFANLNFK